MDLKLWNLNKTPKEFFNILPQDWQDIVVSQWDKFNNSASIYVFKEKNEIIAGGIVFKNSHPNISDFEKKYLYLYKEDYFYIGFVWVIPQKRNQQLASKWTTKLKEINSNQKYWLTIEEESLKYFYEKNGFKLVAESFDINAKEWVLSFTP